ncbi:SPOR domain-containing protein [Flavobacterium aquariorum]|uniref:SPOR domain-containing protein n=1 Tax=Flavobacterium aquariorum TaxID=2217670 RepID=A0A2W7VPG1_9FLAO|nr:SPOR domain-containing protein [Flavobacterium aquariorum]PZX94012.1 SPOR domain-containing protein [Flavobacterium aquariorum]
MRFLRNLKALLLFTLFLITTNRITAQNSNLSLNQDPKFEQLLNEKRKSNSNLSYSDRYKIQIFSGASESAKKTLNEFRQEFTNLDGTIIFNTPNYKVWVGNFRTRMEAERNLVEIQKKYKNVFLIKPSK